MAKGRAPLDDPRLAKMLDNAPPAPRKDFTVAVIS